MTMGAPRNHFCMSFHNVIKNTSDSSFHLSGPRDLDIHRHLHFFEKNKPFFFVTNVIERMSNEILSVMEETENTN